MIKYYFIGVIILISAIIANIIAAKSVSKLGTTF